MTASRRAGGAALLVAAVLPVACMRTHVLDSGPEGGGGGSGSSDGGPNSGDGSDGTSSGDGGGDHGLHCTSGSVLSLTVTHEQPSIVIALDRSPSMTNRLGSGSRFTVTRDAIGEVLKTYGPFVWFGYAEFPGAPDQGCSGSNGCCGDCCAGGLGSFVQPGGNPVGITNNFLNACSNQNTINCINSSETPTAQVINRIDKNFASLNKATQPRYVLLLTDGPPTCTLDSSPPEFACDQTVSAINSMLMVDPRDSNSVPVSTFVVAIGDVAAGPIMPANGNDCLNNLALAGGHARADVPSPAPFYYVANTEALVRSNLDTIVAGTVCHFDIATDASFDRDMIEVDFNGNTIPRDATNQNGWNFASLSQTNNVVIYGAACDHIIQNMTNNSSHKVVIKSCPDPHAP